MLANLLAWVYLRKWSNKDRATLTNALMKGIDAFPIRSIVVIDGPQNISVQGKQLDGVQVASLRESASAALNNRAISLIRDQVRWKAIEEGFLKSDNPEHQLFYKAALWYAQEEKNLLYQIAPQEL